MTIAGGLGRRRSGIAESPAAAVAAVAAGAAAGAAAVLRAILAAPIPVLAEAVEAALAAAARAESNVTLLWQTAVPVKQALIKRQYGAEAGTSPEAKAKLERVDQVYVLTLIGMPGFTLAAAQGDQKAAVARP